MKKFLLIAITVALAFASVGCKKMVNSYTSFSIEEFDDFYDDEDEVYKFYINWRESEKFSKNPVS